jgi:plasmid stabilization system protein ParE
MASPLTYKALFSSRAQKEVAESWNWYEDRQLGLGDRFVREVANKIKLIEQSPDRFPPRLKKFREAQVPVFPFVVIYRVNERKKLIHIVSVFHTSRNPKKKY